MAMPQPATRTAASHSDSNDTPVTTTALPAHKPEGSSRHSWRRALLASPVYSTAAPTAGHADRHVAQVQAWDALVPGNVKFLQSRLSRTSVRYGDTPTV